MSEEINTPTASTHPLPRLQHGIYICLGTGTLLVLVNFVMKQILNQ